MVTLRLTHDVTIYHGSVTGVDSDGRHHTVSNFPGRFPGVFLFFAKQGDIAFAVTMNGELMLSQVQWCGDVLPERTYRWN